MHFINQNKTTIANIINQFLQENGIGEVIWPDDTI